MTGCIRCHGPVDEQGLCPHCDARQIHDTHNKRIQDEENKLTELFRPHFEERIFNAYFVGSIRHVPGARFSLQTDPERNLDLRQLCDRGSYVAGDPDAPYTRPEVESAWQAWKLFIRFFIFNGNEVKATCTICAPGTASPGFARVCVTNEPSLQCFKGLPWKCDGECHLTMAIGDLVDYYRGRQKIAQPHRWFTCVGYWQGEASQPHVHHVCVANEEEAIAAACNQAYEDASRDLIGETEYHNTVVFAGKPEVLSTWAG